ncbi:C39 family peptidase [uncultured Methylophaga sp.]|uniref:C39 family peptidase n=1 Tax=uncultured Methylophaga sp. TaxID=285271 RepID=UPI00260A387A|nr:C39 family peptidase [uncultured Methylophaga sp.]
MKFTKTTLLLLTTSSLWLSMSISSAANMQFGGVVPGTMITKNIISMRERHFIDMVPQQTDFSCGAAALATILNYAYGYDFTEADVIAGMLKVSNPELVQTKGFSLLDIKHYVETLGLRGRGYTVNPEILDRIKIPTIVLLDIRGYKHFVVLKKATPEKVYIADPALGNRVMDRQDFVDGWNKVTFAVIGNGFDRETILLRPKQPLTARNTVDTWRPLTDAELVEYGFYRSELF